MTTIRIKRVKPQRVRAMQDHLLRDGDSVSTWRSDGTYWGAFEGNLMVAFAGLVPSAGWHGAAFFHCAGVMPMYRGRGLQKRMIRIRLAYARRHGMIGARTYTVLDNPASSRSLIACGFKLYRPENMWAGSHVNYWKISL